jgi:hypothetical protein
VVDADYYVVKRNELDWSWFFRKISVSSLRCPFSVFSCDVVTLFISLFMLVHALFNNTKLAHKPRTRLDE